LGEQDINSRSVVSLEKVSLCHNNMSHRRDPFSGDRALHQDTELMTFRLFSARIKARKRIKPQGIVLLAAIAYFAFASIFLSAKEQLSFDASDGTDVAHKRADKRYKYTPESELSLKQFPSLKYPLKNADVVAIFFGASWASETRLVRDAFNRDVSLLPPEGVSRKERYPLAIVYISADDTEGSSEWIHVNNRRERTLLQKRFKICTDKGEHCSGSKQVFRIPSLFVIDAKTKAVMTSNGLDDIQSKGGDALNVWLALKQPSKKEG
jgi:hypothetical protein